VVADHLSRLTMDFTEDTTPISKTFPDEQLMHIAHNPAPWFADIVNYIVILLPTKCLCIGGNKISSNFCQR
jgi:hypothetical protein